MLQWQLFVLIFEQLKWYLLIFPNIGVVWVDAWHSIEEHLLCVSFHSRWSVSTIRWRLRRKGFMYPLQQIPDEESLLELSTIPESQVEYLHSERVHDSTYTIHRSHSAFIWCSKLCPNVTTIQRCHGENLSTKESLSPWQHRLDLPVPYTSRNHLVHEWVEASPAMAALGGMKHEEWTEVYHYWKMND